MFLHFREMFWSDWGHTAKIEMSDMDGQNRQVLIKSGITWPNGLAVDIYKPEKSRILYYTDAYKDIIGSYDLKAKKHKVHSQLSVHVRNMPLYFSEFMVLSPPEVTFKSRCFRRNCMCV